MFFFLKNAYASDSALGVLEDYGAGSQRWRDVAENVYAESYRNAYTYGQANARVMYELAGMSFAGTFDAMGLKPNFAYQLKLEGKPAEDPISDQHLKDIGRTFEIAPSQTVGYVVFDFVVTDRNGEAHSSFSLANTYHVLWKVSQRMPQPNDSNPILNRVEGSSDDPPHAYSTSVGPTDVGVYAQWESGKPVNAQLPPGTYNVNFVITEESFHSAQSDPTGGYWATVIGCYVQFTIVPSMTIPTMPYGALTSALTLLIAYALIEKLKRSRM